MLADPILKPMISEEMLIRMLETLSDGELERLPADRLPDSLSAAIQQRASEEQMQILQDKMLQRDSSRMRQHVNDMEKYGSIIAEALHQAESAAVPRGVELLQENVHDLASLTSNWNQDLRGSLENLSGKCNDINELLHDLLNSTGPILKAETVLTETACNKKNAIDTKRLSMALMRVRKLLAPIEDSLTQFNTLRLSVAQQEMSQLRKRQKGEAGHIEKLQIQIDGLHEQLDQKQSMWSRALSRYKNSEEYSEIQGKISKLISEQRMLEVIIDEEDLQRWLDSIIEACMDPNTVKIEAPRLRATRALLFSHLDLYCQQQEAAAMQIARNPFSQIDAAKVISFMLASEAFILDYFSKKQQSTAAWFRSTAESRRDQLDDLKKDIVKELKRNMKNV